MFSDSFLISSCCVLVLFYLHEFGEKYHQEVLISIVTANLDIEQFSQNYTPCAKCP